MFSCGYSICGSTVFATQPISESPRAAIASAVNKAWLIQPNRIPTTSTIGNPRSLAMSAVS